MLKHYLTSGGGEAWSVSRNAMRTGVLIQLDDENADQIRLNLPVEEALHMASHLIRESEEVMREEMGREK